MSKVRLFPLLLLGISLSLPFSSLQATTLVSFAFEDLTHQAEVIFQGRVLERESGTEQGFPYTWVTFQVEEVLKGEIGASTLVLRFLGGETKGAALQVSDLRIPAADEHGLYFVESLDRALVNPLLGWSQGHFLIDETAGGELGVQRAGEGEPLVLDAKQAALRAKGQGMGFARSGKPLGDKGDHKLEDFKAAIRHELETGQ